MNFILSFEVMMAMKGIALVIIFLFSCSYIQAQSCCSGGVPLSGNIGLPLTESGAFQVALSYDWNVLNTLMSGTEKLDDNTRKRTTHTFILQSGYTITKNWSIEVLLPFIRQERELSPLGLPSTFDSSNGIGDILFLSKYRFLQKSQVGIGVKMPTGSTTEVNSQGIIMNADMQPGSGSWDLILWVGGTYSLTKNSPYSTNYSFSYRATGKNETYFGTQEYEFGNELQGQLGLSRQLLVLNLILSPTLNLKYRITGSDKNDDYEVPSTGGQWLFIQPGFIYSINPKFSIQSTLDLPIYTHLEGTQITPTYRLNFAIVFSF